MHEAACGLLNLVFPEDCRVCGDPLRNFSRIPVCVACLGAAEPFIAEFSCVSCKTPFVNRAPLDEQGQCALCRMGLRGFDAVYTYGSYEGPMRTLVHLFKYGGVRTLVQPFGEWLALALPRDLRFDAVVPMPLYWWRHWRRGFNQSGLLAREVARRWHVPVVHAVRRKKPTKPQAGLTNAKRRANVQGAFAPIRRLDGKHVLLVDDVLTTGATASACARALKRAGAARVTLLTLARTDRRMAIDVSTLADVPAGANTNLRSKGTHA